jgi:hypothetical protein
VNIASLLLPIILPVAVLVGLPWPQRLVARAIIAVLLAWAASIIFTALVYNPAGIASGAEQRIDSHTMQFDNNTIASTVLGGWILPVISVVVFFLFRFVWGRFNNVVSSD